MPTYAELHLLSYFCVIFFVFLSSKIIFGKNTKIWKLLLASIVLSIIKLLMDIFYANIFLQIAVTILCYTSSNIVVFKVNHISKLWPHLGIFFAFYGGIFAFQAAIISVLSKQTINYLSNYYLLCQIGFAFVVFAILLTANEYMHLAKLASLSKDCTLVISKKTIALCGYVDTGNKLVDSESKRAVVIVNIDAIKNTLSTKEYADIVFATNSSGSFECVKKIKFATIGGTNYITIFKPKMFCVASKKVDCFVGVSLANQIKGYDALLGIDFA